MKGKRENFSSRFAMVAALAGSAIGLGNIWRFPYMVGQYGGGAFVLVYLICSVFLALPAFFCEALLGRKGRHGVVGTIDTLFPNSKLSFLGLLCMIAPMLIMSFYSIVGGWSIEYLGKSLAGVFNSISLEESVTDFHNFSSSVWLPLSTHFVFLFLTALVVSLGVKKGIEKFNKVVIPSLFVLIVVIVAYSISLPGSLPGVQYILKPDFSKIDSTVVCFALGQAFFSLSLGMGTVLVYSSYMSRKESIVGTGILTVLFDTGFAILAGLAIMPAVFSAGIEPSSGPGLVFETLPFIFTSLGEEAPFLGYIVPVIFFFAVLLAAITSEISIFEVCYEFLRDQKHFGKKKAIVTVFLVGFLLGVPCSLSFGVMKDFTLFGLTVFDMADFTSSNVLMFIGALTFCILVGWKMKKKDVYLELTNGGEQRFVKKIFRPLYFWIRYVIPPVLIFIFITNLIL